MALSPNVHNATHSLPSAPVPDCENQNASGVITNDGSCESHFQKAYAQAMTSVKKAGGGSMLTEFGALSTLGRREGSLASDAQLRSYTPEATLPHTHTHVLRRRSK